MKIELTPEEIKTLKLFTYYCRGYGAEEVNQHTYISNCEPDRWDSKWYKSDGGMPIDGYDAIGDLLDKLIDQYDLAAKGADRDCDNNAEMTINIDCVERKLSVRITEYRMGQRDMGDSKEIDINEESPYGEMLRKMKQKGYKSGYVTFDGGGDSGEISAQIDFGKGNFEMLNRELENELYNWLENFYGGWEINEGSHGEFTFNVDGNVELSFYEHTEDNVDLGQVLYAEF